MVVHSPPRASGRRSITTVPYCFPEEPLNYSFHERIFKRVQNRDFGAWRAPRQSGK